MTNQNPQAGDEKYRVWDSYWRDNRLYCEGPGTDADIASRFDDHWARAAESLPEGARILDLACGNGYVALTAARVAREAGRSISIDAIDAAAIDPKRYLTQHSELASTINFHGSTLMEELPFEPAAFDAVYSQYGIEFGALTKTCSEVGRVLKPGGAVSVLALSTSTAFVGPLLRKAEQSRRIINDTKLFEISAAVAQALHTSETSGDNRKPELYLQKFSAEVERVMAKVNDEDIGATTAVIATIQDILTKRKQLSIGIQLGAMDKLKTRLTDYIGRNEAVGRSALGDASLAALTRGLSAAELKGALRTEPVVVGNAGTVAWNIST